MLRLGESIERTGSIPARSSTRPPKCVERFVREARQHGAERVEVLVASPGRQAANGERAPRPARRDSGSADAATLGRGGGSARVRRRGRRDPPGQRRLIAVCDVGGGSTQVAVGTRRDGIAWVRSVDIGSMRLTSRTARRATRPATRRSPRARARSTGCSKASCHPCPRSLWPSAAARVLYGRSSARISAPTSSRGGRHPRPHPRPARSRRSTTCTSSASARSRPAR